MFKITTTLKWDGAHRIPTLGPSHPCGRVHGHSFRAEITLQSDKLNRHGFVRDVADLAVLQKFIDSNFVGTMCELSVEQIAKEIFDEAKKLAPETIRVRVYEGFEVWGEYTE